MNQFECLDKTLETLRAGYSLRKSFMFNEHSLVTLVAGEDVLYATITGRSKDFTMIRYDSSPGPAKVTTELDVTIRLTNAKVHAVMCNTNLFEVFMELVSGAISATRDAPELVDAEDIHVLRPRHQFNMTKHMNRNMVNIAKNKPYKKPSVYTEKIRIRCEFLKEYEPPEVLDETPINAAVAAIMLEYGGCDVKWHTVNHWFCLPSDIKYDIFDIVELVAEIKRMCKAASIQMDEKWIWTALMNHLGSIIEPAGSENPQFVITRYDEDEDFEED